MFAEMTPVVSEMTSAWEINLMRIAELTRVLILTITSVAFANLLLFGSAAADEVLVSAGNGAGDDIRNGGFESSDNGHTFYSRWGDDSDSRFQSWRNYRFSQQRHGRDTRHSPPEGKYLGIVNSVTSGPGAGNGSEPSIETGYRIQTGDRFTLSFKYAGALGWNNAPTLKVVATLYYDDDGDGQDGKDNVIDSVAVTPKFSVDEGQFDSTGKLTLRCTADSVGKVARLRFQTNLDRNVYALIDDVSLTVSNHRVVRSNPGVTFLAGELPIILSAPHGGRNGVSDVGVRQGEGVKKFNAKSDFNTDRLTETLAADIKKKTGKRPYVIIARFHRRFIDANRPSPLAYESLDAKTTYDIYHRALSEARREVVDRWGHGLLLDIHGQAARPKAIFRGTQNGKTTKHLISRFGQQAWRGETSLFGRLAQQGFPVIPSVDSPDREHASYAGGYIVRTYGSSTGGTLDAIQLELGRELRSSEAIPSTANRLAEATVAYAAEYLPTKERNSASPTTDEVRSVGDR